MNLKLQCKGAQRLWGWGPVGWTGAAVLALLGVVWGMGWDPVYALQRMCYALAPDESAYWLPRIAIFLRAGFVCPVINTLSCLILFVAAMWARRKPHGWMWACAILAVGVIDFAYDLYFKRASGIAQFGWLLNVYSKHWSDPLRDLGLLAALLICLRFATRSWILPSIVFVATVLWIVAVKFHAFLTWRDVALTHMGHDPWDFNDMEKWWHICLGLAALWGAWVILARHPGPGQCTRCAYDLRGSKGSTCPECGAAIIKADQKAAGPAPSPTPAS